MLIGWPGTFQFARRLSVINEDRVMSGGGLAWAVKKLGLTQDLIAMVLFPDACRI